MTHNLQVGDLNLPCREVVVDAQTYLVPRGIARNYRNRSWQIKIKREGKLVLSGNHSDSLYEGTEGALKSAIDQIVSSTEIRPSRTLKIGAWVTLIWSFSGVNVLGMNALVYDPAVKRSKTIYLISQTKMAANNAGQLKEKLVKALCQGYQSETGNPVDEDLILVKEFEAEKIMASKLWEDFLKVGADVANTHKKD